MNGNQQNNPQIQPPVSVRTPKRSPRWYAFVVGEYVRAMVVLIFWLIVGMAGLAAAYVGIRCIVYGAELILRALG